MNNDYTKGMIDALSTLGALCCSSNCEDCLVGILKGDGQDCREYIMRFPERVASALMGYSDEGYSYYNEFIVRNPSCSLSLDELSSLTCRKALFCGYTECEGGDCLACWSAKYEGDTEGVPNPESDV